MRIDLTKMQVSAIAAMLRDELGDDERAYLDTLEGETDLHEISRKLLDEIEQDEGVQVVLAEQIAARNERKQRAAKRIEAHRTALMALMECAQVDKLPLPEATLSVRKVSPKPVVTDPEAVPDAFCKITKKPDMAAIKAAVEQGASLPGVSLDNGGSSITIRRK